MYSAPSSKTKKLSVILDAQLHKQAKRYAMLNDMTLTDLVVALLEERIVPAGGHPEEAPRLPST
jgi:macrodomain Ter protein organizer (MatP/YcbG family)